MAGKAAELGGILVSDYLSVGLLSRLVPPSLVDEALTAHDRHSKRQRDLPAPAWRWIRPPRSGQIWNQRIPHTLGGRCDAPHRRASFNPSGTAADEKFFLSRVAARQR